MASSKINEKNRAAINELKAELGSESSLENAMTFNSVPGKSQATTRASMLNNGVGAIKYQEKKDWSGSVLGTYPPSISVIRSGKSSHRGVPPKDLNGSMGAVVYVGPNVQGGENNCAWVLAWSVPGDGTPNKIYVETGPSTKYPLGKIDWDPIRAKLTASHTDSYYRDEDTGAEASASIDQSGNIPAAAAIFEVSL